MTISPFKRFLSEPLVHFLLLGSALFGLYSYFSPDGASENTDYDIYLTPDELLQMNVYFESQWKRPPTIEEFGHLLENRVEEEVLYREALAMGLDQDDTIVRRRMAQKMKFLAEDVAAAREPDLEELRQWYAENEGLFAMPGRISFRQIYFSPDKRATQARQAAQAALAQLAGQAIDSPMIASLGDSIMLQEYFGDRSVETLAKEFGPSFAQNVMDIQAGSWQGPIESGLGWHLVFVDSLEPGRIPDFFEVEQEVRTAWLAEQKDLAFRTAFEKMRAKYTVLLPTGPDERTQAISPVSASTQAGENTP
jgi:hypothetical protein